MASRTARKGTSRYKIRNWKQYEAGLIQRGSISFWINDDAIDQWNPEAKDKIRGRRHWCTNRHFDENIGGLLFFHHFQFLKFGYHGISHSKESYKSL